MIKKTLFILFLLLSAMPVLADLPRCECLYCSLHPEDLCKISGTSPSRVCSDYARRCGYRPVSQTAVPSQEQFLSELSSTATRTDTPQSCR
jgi:hypothetical protein